MTDDTTSAHEIDPYEFADKLAKAVAFAPGDPNIGVVIPRFVLEQARAIILQQATDLVALDVSLRDLELRVSLLPKGGFSKVAPHD